MWKQSGALLFLGVLLMFAGACSRTDEPVVPRTPESDRAFPQNSEHRPLRWMGHWKNEGRRERLVREVREDFSFEHPLVDVTFEFATDIFPEKSQEAVGHYICDMIRSGNLEWDVVWLDPLIYYHVAEELDDWDWGRKHLVDFSGVEGFPECHQPFLLDGPELRMHTGGILTGPYIEGYYYALWYNKELADKLGIEVKEQGMTARDLLDCVERLHAYNRLSQEPVAAFVSFKNSGSLLRLFYGLMLSCLPQDEIAKNSQADLDAAMNRTVSFFEKVGKSKPSASVLTVDSMEDAAHALMGGRALFFPDATWRYNAFEKIDPEGLNRLRLAQMPEFAEGFHRVLGGYMPTWAVFKNAPGREEGIELMRFWCRPNIAEKWIRHTKCPTGLKGSLYDPKYGRDVYANFQRQLTAPGVPPTFDPLVFYQHPQDRELAVDEDFLDDFLAYVCDEYSMNEEDRNR